MYSTMNINKIKRGGGYLMNLTTWEEWGGFRDSDLSQEIVLPESDIRRKIRHKNYIQLIKMALKRLVWITIIVFDAFLLWDLMFNYGAFTLKTFFLLFPA